MTDIDYNIEEDQDIVFKGKVAQIKLIINIIISCLDAIPGLGWISWLADAWKFISPHVFIEFQVKYKIDLDLTSGTSKKLAVFTEALEPITGGITPTHGIETMIWYRREGRAQIEAMRKVFERRHTKFLPD